MSAQTVTTASSWDMTQMYPLGPAFSTSVAGSPGGFTVQPFTPAVTGRPSLLRIFGGNANWNMTVDFEIWCAGNLVAAKTVNTSGLNQYELSGYVFRVSFDDVATDDRLVLAGQPCELRIQTKTTSIPDTGFGVQLTRHTAPKVGTFDRVRFQDYSDSDIGDQCLRIDLTVQPRKDPREIIGESIEKSIKDMLNNLPKFPRW